MRVGPDVTSRYRAASRTERTIGPRTGFSDEGNGPGPRPERPNVAFMPNSPLYDDGMRIDPPPSPPVHIGNSPAATAAAEPPEDPPGVFERSHGLRVTPCSGVLVKLTVPNSDAVVSPVMTAPAARSRSTSLSSRSATQSA